MNISKETLMNRQIIADNVQELIIKGSEDKNQLNLFSDIDELVELRKKQELTYLEILEKEREALGIILSVDYLRNSTMFIDLLRINRLSSANLNNRNEDAIAICISKIEEISRKGHKFYTVEFGDSIRKINVRIYNPNIYNNIIIGDTYAIKISSESYYKDNSFFSLIRYMNLDNKKLSDIFTEPIALENYNDDLTKDKEKALDFIIYISELIDKATDDNYVNMFVNTPHSKSTIYKIKFDNEIYNYFLNNFNFTFKY